MELKAPAGSLMTLNQSLATTNAPSFTGLTTSGNINLATILAFLPKGIVRKRITLYEDGLSDTDHRFFGFGITGGILVYQANAASDSHVFYAATSPTTSNELFRIAGSGAVSCGGTLSSGGLISTGLNQQLRLLPSANNGETSIRFNTQTNETGTNWFAGQGVSTSGAGNFGIGNSVSGVVLNMIGSAISCPGSLTAGSLTTTGALTAPSITFPSGTINYYEDFAGSLSFDGAGSVSVNYNIVRVNNLITLSFWEGGYIASTTASSRLISSTAIPSSFYNSSASGPLNPCGFIPMVCSAGMPTACPIVIDRVFGIVSIGYPSVDNYFPTGIAMNFSNGAFSYHL
jgi:hypothetical protein